MSDLMSRLEKIERETAGLLSAQVNDIPAIGEARALIEKLVEALRDSRVLIEALAKIGDPNGDPSGIMSGLTVAAIDAALSEAERSGG